MKENHEVKEDDFLAELMKEGEETKEGVKEFVGEKKEEAEELEKEEVETTEKEEKREWPEKERVTERMTDRMERIKPRLRLKRIEQIANRRMEVEETQGMEIYKFIYLITLFI